MNKMHVPHSEKSRVQQDRLATDDSSLKHLERGMEEKLLLRDLYEGLRDTLFPPKLPPLEMTSTPIPSPDRMATKTNPWAIGTATIVNGGIVLLIAGLGVSSTTHHLPIAPIGASIQLKDFVLFAPSRGQSTQGGGGGGSNDLIDPITGRTPRVEQSPLMPVQIPILENSKLAILSAIAVPPEIKLPDNPSLPTIGVHQSTNVTLVSGGQGTHLGIGTGANGGDGPGDGIGYGPGSNRGFGDSVYRPGIGGVSNPVPIFTPDADFSDEARRNKYQGVCMISVIIDAHGNPHNPRIVQTLGMGLDEKAVEAVRKYRFKPALKDGRPVASIITVAVNFRLY